jgi:hypothetical protein
MASEVASYALAVNHSNSYVVKWYSLQVSWARTQKDVRILSTMSRCGLAPFAFIAILITICLRLIFLANSNLWHFCIFDGFRKHRFYITVESVLTAGSKPLVTGLVGWIIVLGLFLLFWPCSLNMMAKEETN